MNSVYPFASGQALFLVHGNSGSCELKNFDKYKNILLYL